MGFVVASTSIDDICEMADDASESGAAAKKTSEYNRSSLKLAGYVGVTNAAGGSFVALF